MDGEGGPTDARPKRRKARVRALSEEETKLWRAVVKDARPLARPNPLTEPPEETAPRTAIVSKPKQQTGIVTGPGTIRPVPKPLPSPEPPPLTGLDRRTSQRLARGQVEAEARLDLHGLGRDEAEERLHRFLVRARADGLRLVLVITGKGVSPFTRHTLHGKHYHEAAEHSGVLRAALPVWLGERRFRGEVAGFQPAHPRHGGGGAFYVWLRKRR